MGLRYATSTTPFFLFFSFLFFLFFLSLSLYVSSSQIKMNDSLVTLIFRNISESTLKKLVTKVNSMNIYGLCRFSGETIMFHNQCSLVRGCNALLVTFGISHDFEFGNPMYSMYDASNNIFLMGRKKRKKKKSQ